MKVKLLIGILLSTIWGNSSWAGSLNAPLGLPSATVLPKGVSRLSYKGIMSSAETRLNSRGEKESLGESLAKDISYQAMMDSKDKLLEKYGIEHKMLSSGATDRDQILGRTTGQINVAVTGHVPIFSYGVSKRWSLGLAIPITRYSLNIDYGVMHSNTEAIIALKDAMDKDLPARGRELEEKLMDPLGSSLRDNKYTPLKNENKTKLGDIKLVSKIKTYENSHHTLTLVNSVVFPTGKTADINKLIDIPSGDGQTDLSMGLVHDLYFGSGFSLSSQLNYIWQMKDYLAGRVPERQDSRLTPDIDENVKRNLGNIIQLEVAPKFKFNAFNIGLGYGLQYKSGDEYQGIKYQRDRYEWMARNTVQRMQSLTAVGGFDTVSLYQQKKFGLPLALALSHSLIIDGKNIGNDALTALDLSIFF